MSLNLDILDLLVKYFKKKRSPKNSEQAHLYRLELVIFKEQGEVTELQKS